MNNKSLKKFSLITLIIGLVVLVIAFFFFHFVTDTGITTVFQKEAGKPFVTLLIGIFGVLNVFASLISFISAIIFFPKDKNK